MAAKQPAVGIDHLTVVPTNAARDDDRPIGERGADDPVECVGDDDARDGHTGTDA